MVARCWFIVLMWEIWGYATNHTYPHSLYQICLWVGSIGSPSWLRTRVSSCKRKIGLIGQLLLLHPNQPWNDLDKGCGIKGPLRTMFLHRSPTNKPTRVCSWLRKSRLQSRSDTRGYNSKKQVISPGNTRKVILSGIYNDTECIICFECKM